LSFVEDPTRLLRAARYAARLDLKADAWTARCQALALRLAPYPALSGQRIATDLERLLDEPRCAAALAHLARGGVPRLLDPRWRLTRATSARLAAVPATLAWVAAHRQDRPTIRPVIRRGPGARRRSAGRGGGRDGRTPRPQRRAVDRAAPRAGRGLRR